MRWVKGPSLSLPARPAPGGVESNDVLPEAYWDEDSRQLTVKQKPFDALSQKIPAQAAVFAIPESSDLVRADAIDLITSDLLRTVTPLPSDEADVVLPLPSYDDSVNNALQVIYGFTD